MSPCKSKTPRDTVPSTRRTQMDMEPAKSDDTELLKERTQRNTGCFVGTRLEHREKVVG